MRRINVLCIVLAAGLISACEWQEQSGRSIGGVPACGSEQVTAQYQDIIRERLTHVTALRIQADYADLVDNARVMDGFAHSTVTLENAHRDDGTDETAQRTNCRAQLNITLPPAVFDAAKNYAPFIYAPNRYETELNNVANINLVSRQDKGNVFTQMVSYTVTADSAGQQAAVTANDTEITRIAQTLTAALLPYGVKDSVTVDGVPMPREDALRQLVYPAADDKGMGNAFNTLDSDTPIIQTASAAMAQSGDLKAAQNHFAAAQEELNTLWSKLDDTVRQSLAEEEGLWVAALNTRCAQSTSEYANLECRTRLVEERVRYLRGFAID